MTDRQLKTDTILVVLVGHQVCYEGQSSGDNVDRGVVPRCELNELGMKPVMEVIGRSKSQSFVPGPGTFLNVRAALTLRTTAFAMHLAPRYPMMSTIRLIPCRSAILAVEAANIVSPSVDICTGLMDIARPSCAS